MSALLVAVFVVGWFVVAGLAFVALDAIFGQPLLGKWWRRR